MPILARPPTSPPPPARPTGKHIIWTSAAGDVIDLTDRTGGYFCQPGRTGFGMPDREVVYDSLPAGGGILRDIVDQVRVLALPLRIEGSTADQYLARFARMQAACRHPRLLGEVVPGTLTVGLPDGSSRSISALYNGGLDVTEDDMDDLLMAGASFPRLEFLALSPYWVGGSVSATWAIDASVTFFGAMPLTLSASQVLGEVTLDVPGDAPSPPIWTITGPGTPTLTNNTTGRSFAFADAISSGRTVTVDTRDDQLTVIDDLDADLYSTLEPFPDLWPLEPGVNSLQVDMADATSASVISVTAPIRHQTGW